MLDSLNIEEIPAATFRMGRPGDRPRLLKVIFQHRGAARLFLQKRGTLKTTTFSNISIRESMTKEALAERSAMIAERYKRNAALGETELAENPWVVYANVLQRRSDIKKKNVNY
jgi:hypothetical protein